MNSTGKKKWIIPDGHIPEKSNGIEPDLLSRDSLAILNTGDGPASVTVTLYHTGSDPVAYNTVSIAARRLRKILINDLIDPFPVFLGTDYSVMVESDHEIIVQFLRMDTSSPSAIMGTIAYGED